MLCHATCVQTDSNPSADIYKESWVRQQGAIRDQTNLYPKVFRKLHCATSGWIHERLATARKCDCLQTDVAKVLYQSGHI
jgi:hypothetical protein